MSIRYSRNAGERILSGKIGATLRLAMVLVVAVLVAVLATSCASSAGSASSAASSSSKSSSAAVSASSSSASSSAAASSSDARAADKMQADSTNASGTQSYIDKDQALGIALADAQLSKDSVTVQENQIKTDDGIVIYEIEFLSGNTEYEYEINATTGAIIEAASEMIAIPQ